MAGDYRHHDEASVRVMASPTDTFAYLDDPRRLSAHMESSSPMMAGTSMRIEMDELQGKAVGSRIRLSGSILGLALELDEAVTEYQPPRRKVWETLGTPRLLVIGSYRMGFEVEPVEGGSRIRLWIDYERPTQGIGRWLGSALGRTYARWCTTRMLSDLRRQFGSSRDDT